MNCPRCRAGVYSESTHGIFFKCHSKNWKDGCFEQSDRCIEWERDQLATTIYELREMVEYLAAMGDQLAKELKKLGGSKELTDAYEDQAGLIKKNLVRLLGKDE